MDQTPSKKPWHRFKNVNFKPLNRKARRAEQASLRHAHRFVIKRFSNLRSIRRHVIGWLVLASILIGLAATGFGLNMNVLSNNKPVGGGAYAEGVVDSIETLNPLYATTQAERAAGRLIFAGLLKYDTDGKLQPDLAESWEVKENGLVYVVDLKPHLRWQDGESLQADDIVNTVKTIQDPKVGSVNRQSWQGIQVDAITKRQVKFRLPAQYAPFESALTFPILPAHIIETIQPEELRDSEFSKSPIGSGPFEYESLKSIDVTNGKNALQLIRNETYWEGLPKLARFSLYTYSTDDDLRRGLISHEINAAIDMSTSDIKSLNKDDFKAYQLSLNSGVYALFNNTSQTLSSQPIRQALVQSIDLENIRQELDVQELDSPVISNQLPLSVVVKQRSFDKQAAKQLLKKEGWKINKTSKLYEKNKQPLTLRLVTIDNEIYKKLASLLVQQWKDFGISVELQTVDPDQAQQLTLRPRAYDILVHQLEIGGDPDSYAYWHSSQVEGVGLNFSNYSSEVSDDALLTARIRTDPQLRDAKYTTFAKTWVSDAPALSVYQPTLWYVTSENVGSLDNTVNLPTPIDRFNFVDEWTVQSNVVRNTP